MRGISLIAEALDVPIARFFIDEDGSTRLECRRFQADRIEATRASIFGDEFLD